MVPRKYVMIRILQVLHQKVILNTCRITYVYFSKNQFFLHLHNSKRIILKILRGPINFISLMHRRSIMLSRICYELSAACCVKVLMRTEIMQFCYFKEIKKLQSPHWYSVHYLRT